MASGQGGSLPPGGGGQGFAGPGALGVLGGPSGVGVVGGGTGIGAGMGGAGVSAGVSAGVPGPREVNMASLCRIGQETVQDIVTRTTEIFQILRYMQLPNGGSYLPSTHADRLSKLQEHLRQLTVLFRKLRLIYDKCNETCSLLQPEQHIPFIEEESPRTEEWSQNSAALRFANEERRDISEKLRQKNQQLKVIMDQLRNLIWDINTMMSSHS
ncbi:mediator of RNA polymerase II transcription subunit 30 isoform X1 [Petromyzon marinus]|uniref:Mediator of RNA polymerase II transcription subunit 30 n=1 Tax=Petromyzon marinus TaxID=7757 RepID=A0AAJ7TXV4_PETMA|nr:mediator of RNA polymerase II transcription subunit 30 isoform X1 [Petromyzon marinus]